MQASNIPSKVPLPFANSGTKNTIPTASQIGVTPGAASLTDGFPPLTMTPLASGGVPPAGADFNGIFNLITAIQQWQSAGGSFKYDSAFSTSVGGYPKGAVLVNLAADGMWLNLVDNNTTNPDATDGSAANWAPVDNYGVTTIALTNANVTLTPAQFSKPIIILTGALTGNIQLTMPKLVGTWYVVNSTTGAFTTQMLTASGTPITIAPGGSAEIRGDGTNVNIDALQVAPATQSQHAVQLAQAQSGSIIYAADTGTANTYQIPIAPAPTTLYDGFLIRFKAKTSNTGPSTLAVGSQTPAPLLGLSFSSSTSQQLQGGEIIAGYFYQASWSIGLAAWLLIGQSGGALQVAPATQSQHAVQLGQLTTGGINPGRLLRTSVYTNVGGTQYVSIDGAAATTTGATTFTSLAATRAHDVEAIGGGGAGGGAAATDSTHVSAGSGGASGSWARSRYTGGVLSGIAITVGAGGVGNSAATGGAGGTTSFGALLSCPGGGGGGAAISPTSNAVYFANQGATGSAPSGSGILFGTVGQPGPLGYMYGAQGSASGQGAPSPYGGGGPNTGTGAGSAGNGYGSGGGGAGIGVSSSAQAGGAGAPGILIVREYA